MEIDVQPHHDFFDQDIFLVVAAHASAGRTFSTRDGPLKYPSEIAATEYAEECIQVSWMITRSLHKGDPSMKTRGVRSIPQAELIRLALKLREDLVNLPETVLGSRDLAEFMNSAAALIVAITEPERSRLHAALPGKKTAQMYSFPARRGIVPISLH
jgi:hypothetical protein